MASSFVSFPSLHFFTILIFLFSLASAEESCVPRPISLPVENVTLASGYVRRGVNLKVGEPGQSLSFMPRWSNNNTFVYGPDCQKTDFLLEECVTFRGGLYEPDNSTVDQAISKDYTPVTEYWDSSTYKMFNSTLSLGNELTLKGFPLAKPVNPDPWELNGLTPQHIIGVGLGPESILLSTLRNAGRIASQSVGYWWGLEATDPDDETSGSMVFGGYDRAKTYGNGHEMEFSYGKDWCRTKMMVSISDLVLNFRNGTDVSILASDADEPLLVCIQPQNPILLSLNQSLYFDKLMDAIGNRFIETSLTQEVDWTSAKLDPELPVYDGDFTIKLNTGLTITIPNKQLIAPERKIDENGEIYRNDSQPILRINRIEDGGGIMNIGRHFFTAAYLATNEDAGKFTIWRANPTTDQDLVALDTKNKPVNSKATCTAAPVNTISANPDQGGDDDEKSEDGEDDKDKASETTTTPTAAPDGDYGLPIGAKAGIAVSVGATGLICIGLLVWLIISRKRQARGESDAMSLASAQTGWSRSGDMKMVQGYPHSQPQELSAYRPPAEMP